MTYYSRRQTLQLGAGVMATALAPAARAQGAVIKRPIPHSGEMLPVVGLGTARGFGSADRAQTRKVIETLLEGGGSLIDTASTYGAAEEAIGQAVSEAGLRDKVFIATKLEAEDAQEIGRAHV